MAAESDVTAGRREFSRRRAQAGISRADLAIRAHVSLSTVIRYESGAPTRWASEQAIRRAYEDILAARQLGPDSGRGHLDAGWLRRYTDSFLRQHAVGVVEKQKLAHFVLSSDRLYEYGRLLLLQLGKNID